MKMDSKENSEDRNQNNGKDQKIFFLQAGRGWKKTKRHNNSALTTVGPDPMPLSEGNRTHYWSSMFTDPNNSLPGRTDS